LYILLTKVSKEILVLAKICKELQRAISTNYFSKPIHLSYELLTLVY
jgi:hypothetical protein